MFLCRECKHLTNRSALSHATLYAMVLLKSKLIFLTLLVLYLNFPGKVLDHLNFRLIINRSSHVSFKAVPLYLNRDTFQLLKDFALQTALSKITISINYIKERIVIEVRSTRSTSRGRCSFLIDYYIIARWNRYTCVISIHYDL